MLKLVAFCFIFPVVSAENGVETRLLEAQKPPNLENLNAEESEAAAALWASFADLKRVHEVCI